MMMGRVNQYSYVIVSVCFIQTWDNGLKRSQMKTLLIWLKLKVIMIVAKHNFAKDIRQLHDETWRSWCEIT